MEISKLTKKDGKLSGGFTTLTLTQLKSRSLTKPTI